MGGFSLSEKLPFLFFCGFFEFFGEGVCGFSGGILWGEVICVRLEEDMGD